MFKVLDVKIDVYKPTPEELLSEYYGLDSIIIKGENGKYYGIESNKEPDIVWEELDPDIERIIIESDMENVTELITIKDAVEVWYDKRILLKQLRL